MIATGGGAGVALGAAVVVVETDTIGLVPKEVIAATWNWYGVLASKPVTVVVVPVPTPSANVVHEPADPARNCKT
jgi:hypothetical protein